MNESIPEKVQVDEILWRLDKYTTILKKARSQPLSESDAEFLLDNFGEVTGLALHPTSPFRQFFVNSSSQG